MTPRGQTGTILVVDDDPINRMLLRRSLSADGHTVREAENGVRALELLATSRDDVVLLDIVMPEMDGIAVLDAIKSDPGLRDIAVIMISGLDDFASVVRCIEAGAEDYLPKPFDPVLLRARISAGLNKRRVHELERARVRDVFARFLPESVVDQVLINGDEGVRLGGVRLVSTALFADLRGFTSFAESTAPDQVIEVLNRFLGEMSDAVLDHGGTLVTYLGDGLLAVFGAPIPSDDHADRALRAAREMLSERLPRFNSWLHETTGAAGFAIGVGISSGPLMSGNVGSERRLDYTAIGDTVNTASRIESLTKDLPLELLVCGSTRELLTEAREALVFVDEVTLRGRTNPTHLWTLSGDHP